MAAAAFARAASLRSLKVMTGNDGEAQAELDDRTTEEQTTFVVHAEGHELDDVVAREGILRDIAKQSGGEFRDGSFGNPSVRPPRKVRVGSLRVGIFPDTDGVGPVARRERLGGLLNFYYREAA